MTARNTEGGDYGTQYGKWKVISTAQFRSGKRGNWSVLCKCECGTELAITLTKLRIGATSMCKSCSSRATKNIKHGMANTLSWNSWASMKTRCLNEKSSDYHRYGGRGVCICKEWVESFAQFHADMGERKEGQTLDRIDVNGDYEPSNCRWASHAEQCRNKRITKIYSLDGVDMTIPEISRAKHIPVTTLAARVSRGMSIDAAVSTPIDKKKQMASRIAAEKRAS